MKLTLAQAAVRLGKSQRQIRYMIQQNRLPAEQIGGRWFVEDSDLPLPDGKQQAKDRKLRQLHAAVSEALDMPEAPPSRYSIADLKAFQIAVPVYRQALERFGEHHLVCRALRQCLYHLAQGCHRFDRQEKAVSYGAARDEASLAACELLLEASEGSKNLAITLEQELMAALAGLLRRTDRSRRTH